VSSDGDHGRRLIIAGAGPFAEMISRTLESRCARATALFVVDEEFMPAAEMRGVRVESLRSALRTEEPGACDWLVGVADYRGRLKARARIVDQICGAGHVLGGLVDPSAVIDPGLVDPTSMIFANATVDALAEIGKGSVLRSGVTVGHHTRIGPCSYVAPGASIAGRVSVGARTFIGVGAVVRDGVSIGDGCIIGAGCVVLSDVADGAVVADRRRSGAAGE
jgi:sugar O-acyltransferase (sialic acid O-acetyltransferase NeuD family)